MEHLATQAAAAAAELDGESDGEVVVNAADAAEEEVEEDAVKALAEAVERLTLNETRTNANGAPILSRMGEHQRVSVCAASNQVWCNNPMAETSLYLTAPLCGRVQPHSRESSIFRRRSGPHVRSRFIKEISLEQARKLHVVSGGFVINGAKDRVVVYYAHSVNLYIDAPKF